MVISNDDSNNNNNNSLKVSEGVSRTSIMISLCRVFLNNRYHKINNQNNEKSNTIIKELDDSYIPDKLCINDPYSRFFIDTEESDQILNRINSKDTKERNNSIATKIREWEKYIPRMSIIDVGVRTFYIDTCLEEFIANNKDGQVVFCGAGLDTRAMRLKYLTEKYSVFEIDLPHVIDFKEKVLLPVEKSISRISTCKLVRMGTSLLDNGWVNQLKANGFNPKVKTFWILEGLVMYFNQDQVEQLLSLISENSSEGSQLFVESVQPLTKEMEENLVKRKSAYLLSFYKNNFHFFIHESQIQPFLGKFGFQHNFKTLTTSEINQKFSIHDLDPKDFLNYLNYTYVSK
eukprot:gene1932-2367_t